MLSNVGIGGWGGNPPHCSGPFFDMSYLGAHGLVSQKETPGRVTEIIYYLGKLGEVITSERGGCERNSLLEAGYFTENYPKSVKMPSRGIVTYTRR